MRLTPLLVTIALLTVASGCTTTAAYDPASFPYESPLQTHNRAVITALAAEPLADSHFNPRRLHSAAARLLADPIDKAALTYISAPEILHRTDAATNVHLARLLGLLGPKLPDAWKREFFRDVAAARLRPPSP